MAPGRISFPASIRSRKSQRLCRHSGRRNRLPKCPASSVERFSVPAELRHGLEARRWQMSPELAAHFNPAGRTWQEMFGEAANEVFMAWRYALFVNQVIQAGKEE